jgi:LysM repeat protein
MVKLLSFCIAFIGFSFLMNQVAFAQTDLDEELPDTIAIPAKSTITIPPFNRINPDTLKIGVNDEIVSDSYCALGMPAVYDALHSFHSRRMDKFGGYINWKINKGLENIRKKGFKSDIKNLYIQIDPKTLTVYWIAVVGPSTDGRCYVRFDSRGSAGGGVRAVENQLPMMHSYYPTLNEVKVLEFNENVTKCFDWNGNPVSSYTSYVNIRQHFFKYYDLQVDASITLEEYTKKYPYNTEGANLPGKKKPVVKSRQRKYKVKSGDTLSEIAHKYHTTVSKIKKANGLRSDLIRTGQVLKIP